MLPRGEDAVERFLPTLGDSSGLGGVAGTPRLYGEPGEWWPDVWSAEDATGDKSLLTFPGELGEGKPGCRAAVRDGDAGKCFMRPKGDSDAKLADFFRIPAEGGMVGRPLIPFRLPAGEHGRGLGGVCGWELWREP